MLKWIWKVIWRCIFVPVIVTFVVMLISMFFINDANQTSEREKAYEANYGTSYQHYSDESKQNPGFVSSYNTYSSNRNYVPKTVEMEQDDFDATGIIATIALFASFLFMLVYTILDIRSSLKKEIEH